MVLKNAFAAALCTGLLILGGAALADEYRADQFLGLDPSKAVLSPKRLGPETQFAPVRIEARSESRPVKTERVVVAKEAAPKPQMRRARREAGARRETARGRPHQAGAASQQPARCPGARHADPEMAVHVRRHLRLAVALNLLRRREPPSWRGAEAMTHRFAAPQDEVWQLV